MPDKHKGRIEFVEVSAKTGSQRLVAIDASESVDITATGKWKTHKRDGQLVETGPGGLDTKLGNRREGSLGAFILAGTKVQSRAYFEKDDDLVTLHGPGNLRMGAHDEPQGYGDNQGFVTARLDIYKHG